ncbi:MAG: enoyl-CoA hydratase family protein [Pseudomonadota bacterium]
MSLARVEHEGRTLVVVNDNAGKRGALSQDLYDALNEALTRAKDPVIRAVIIRSEGGFFCSGGDLNTLKTRSALSLEERRAKVQELHDIIAGIRTCPVPVIAAVEGGAAGAGLSLALACDILVAAEGAKFTASYVKAGVVPDAGLTAALARMIPRQLSSEMCLLARTVTADRFAELGVVNALVPAGTAITKAQDFAEAFAQGPRHAQGTIKGLLRSAYDGTEAAQLDAEREAMIRAVVDTEAQIGIAAFLDKKTPEYP